MDSNAVVVGVGLAVVIAGAIHFGWLQAMAFCEKLESFNISISEWRAYTPPVRSSNAAPSAEGQESPARFLFRTAR